MAVTLPTSSVAATTTACISPQLPLISLRETVAKINMPTAVVQASVVNNQVTPVATTVSAETVYNLTLTNGDIHTATSSAIAKLPSVAALTVPRDFKNDPVTTTSQKPIIVTVSGMAQMAKQLTSATNVLTAPLLSAPVHMVTQHFTTDKLPSSSGIVTLPTLPRAANVNPVISAKPRQTQHITPLIPGSIITSSKGQLMIASANSPLIGSSTASVITTMSGISLNSSIVTVTPVIMTSTAPLVSLPANSAVTLNQVTQGQVLSTMIQPNVKPTLTANNKTIVPATFLKPVNIAAANPTPFPMAVQPASIAPAAITITPAPTPAAVANPTPVSSSPAPTSTVPPSRSLQKEHDVDPKCDPKSAEYDPIQAMEWKDGIGTLPGNPFKFKINEFGTLEMITNEELCPPPPLPHKNVKDESTATTSEDNSSESRQKTARNKEMYKDESNSEKIPQNGPKNPSMSEELCRCENCDCFGLRVEFCKSGRFCSQTCAAAFTNKKNNCLKRGATKEKMKKKKLKTESFSDDNMEMKSEETGSEESVEIKKEYSESKKEFSWDDYLKQTDAIAAPVKLFKPDQTFPSEKNNFEVGMKLEGIDPKHPSLFCVLTVSEIRGYRIRLHFDGYSECYDFWVNADSQDIFPIGWSEKNGHKLQPPKGFTPQEFEWESYLKLSKAEAAPEHLFALKGNQAPNPNFKVGMKIEAVDKKSKSSNSGSKCMVCVATITDVMDNRFLIHFDGWEDVYDYWADPSSPHIHAINWCRDNGENLTPPKEFKDNSSFNWTKYLNDTRSIAVPPRAFKVRPPNEFKAGMKLEVVDKRNPILIRVATIAERSDHALLIHFDGWSGVYDFWIDDNSPDLHPAGWCFKTGHPLEPPIVTAPGQPGPCPTAGCLGQGHIKGPKYTTHHSTFGCPYAPGNINKIDSAFQDRVIITKESLNDYSKKTSEQGGATDGLRRCPTPGCNGVGHVKGKYSVHHRVSGCPLAEKNALKIQQSTATSNSSPSSTPTPRTTSPPPPTSSSNTESKNSDIMKTRNGVGRGKKKLKFPGTGLRGRPPKHITVMRLEAMKKAQEASEKKNDIEEKVHDSVFNAPFTNPPKEVPLSWEHNTTIIPGLSSIRGSAVRQWSVNQVAKFVSSLKGCIDQGKLFREQLIDGEALLEMNQSDLIDVLHMRLGPALKVYSSIVAFKESEKFV